MLGEAEVGLSQGLTVGRVCCRLEISEQTYYRWRKQYGGIKISQAEIKSRKELKDRLKTIRNYDGVTGVTSFKTNGEVDKKLYLFRNVKDRFVEVED